jgi:hypothetical protein
MAIALRTADTVKLVYTGDESVESDVTEHVWLDVDDVESHDGATVVEVRPLDALTFRRALSHDDELENERALIEAAVLTVDGKGFDEHGAESVCELFTGGQHEILSALAVAVLEVSTGKAGRLLTSSSTAGASQA